MYGIDTRGATARPLLFSAYNRPYALCDLSLSLLSNPVFWGSDSGTMRDIQRPQYRLAPSERERRQRS